MNFVIMPALIGPLLGPTVGGLIVHWTAWREIFFVNVPVGLAALYLVLRHMPDYHGAEQRPLDVIGLMLFGSGTALLSWLLEVFGEHTLDTVTVLLMLRSCRWRCWRPTAGTRSQHKYPLLRLALFKVRTFRISVLGGFITRLGVGGLPFLLPLLYQLGLGLPAWQSGLLMMPTAAAAMGMKLIAREGACALRLPPGAGGEHDLHRPDHRPVLAGRPGHALVCDRRHRPAAGLLQFAAVLQHEHAGLRRHRSRATPAWPAPSPARSSRCR